MAVKGYYCSVCNCEIGPEDECYMYHSGILNNNINTIVFCGKCIDRIDEVRDGRLKIEDVRVQEITHTQR